MSGSPRLYEVWHKHDDFEFSEEEQPTLICEAAASFSQWAGDLVDRTNEIGDVIAVNQAKVLLLDRYWAWYAAVPRRHRNHIGQRGSHVCIYQVFAETYARLRALELSLVPPRLFEPPPQPEPAVAQVPALFLGRKEN